MHGRYGHVQYIQKIIFLIYYVFAKTLIESNQTDPNPFIGIRGEFE